jgi:glycosyltransferase involved in cell wall biosynthesis
MNEKNKRIGIFEYDWRMYDFIKDLAIRLAETGYGVDIFYKDVYVRPDFANIREFDLYENIRFFNFTTRKTRQQILLTKMEKLRNLLAMYFRVPIRAKPHEIIDHNILSKSRNIIGESQYLCFIGIEKKGLIWAGLLSQIYECPLIYYSLELYIEDNPAMYAVYHLREAEKTYHRQSIATIIQDGPRASALLKSNGIEHTNVLYLPVSVRGQIIEQRSKFLQDKFHIGDDRKILLYFGNLLHTRFLTQIVSVAKELDDDIILVIHGFGQKRYLDYLQSVADKNRVVFSLDYVPEDEIENLISSAHIGIALYETTNVNDRLMAFSSSKMAYYPQCGIPVIAFDTASFRTLMDIHKCGELIKSIDQIPGATRSILENYDSYRREAFAAFKDFYDFDKHFPTFLTQLESAVRKI